MQTKMVRRMSVLKYIRLLLCPGICLAIAGNALGAPTIPVPTVTPSSVSLNTATPVLFTVAISDPTVVGASVNLQRLDPSGTTFAVVGSLYDDGTNGDATAGDGIYSLQLTLTEPSPYPVTFRVSAAFKGSLTRVFSNLVPVSVTGATTSMVSFSAPANLSFFNASPITVTGTVSDPTATVTINGLAVPLTGTGFTVSVPLQEGNNTLTATAQTSLGAVSTSSVQVTLDTMPPRVSIDSPFDSFTTTDASITVTGKANDTVVGTVSDQQVQITVNGVAATVANRGFMAANIPLSLGDNTIAATARDHAGNGATASIVVRRVAATQSRITIVSGNNQSAAIGQQLASPLVVSLVDGAGSAVTGVTVVFTVTQNNGTLTGGKQTVAASTDSSGRATVNWTVGTRSGSGNNIVEATAVGFANSAIFAASGLAGSPGQISVDAGGDQIGAVGQPLPHPFVVAVTDAEHNRLMSVPVTFNVTQGGGNFGGKTSLTTTTDSDGRALAILTLGSQDGIANNVVEANFSGNTGFPAAFSSSGKIPGDPSGTRITGVVLDNSNNPVPGATIRAFLNNVAALQSGGIPPAVTAISDSQGQFVIQPAPVGYVKIIADGSTVTRPGKWPNLEYELVTVSGVTNTIGLPIYLLPLDQNHQLCVSDTAGGTLNLPDIPGFSLSVLPGAATFPGGSKSGCITVTSVHPDKIPMVPGFGQQPRFIVTIQPAGTLFSPPAAITIPNADGLKPREVTEMYSFDHDLNTFVSVGTATVSDDATLIRSDPGVGVLKAGWYCGGPPTPAGSVGVCGDCKKCSGSTCVKDDLQNGNVCTTAAGLAGVCSDSIGNCTPITVLIKSIWSEQYPGITVNGLPVVAGTVRGAGDRGDPSNYVLMATRSDGSVAVGGELSVTPDTPEVKAKVMVGVQKTGSLPEGSGSLSGDIALVTTIQPSDTQDYYLVAGVDTNHNGSLDANEVLAKSTWSYKVVPPTRYGSELSFLTLSKYTSFAFPNAANLLLSFLLSNVPSGASASLATLTIDEDCLSHNVGAKFSSSGVANIPSYQFPATSSYADDIRNSATVNNFIDATINNNLAEVSAYFATHPAETAHTFGPWVLSNSNGQTVGGADCTNKDSPTQLAAEFSDDGNPSDLYYALGSADLRAKVTVDIVKIGSIVTDTGATIVDGSVFDLYDFDYDAGDLSHSAAAVQAGFDTLGSGGDVYKVTVSLNGVVRRLPPP